MEWVQDRCICLRKTEYSETSQILTLFSRAHGIVRVIAKGAHRRTKAGASKFDGGVDTLDVGDAVFRHDPARELPPLTEWHLVEGHLAIRGNLRSIYLGLYAAELVARLIEEHDPHPAIFDQLERVLSDLATSRREEAFLAFELDLLRESGYVPELFTCVACRRKMEGNETSYFSAARGGAVCRSCESTVPDRLEVDARLLRLLQGLLRPARGAPAARLPQLTRRQTDPLNRLLADHIEHVLGKRMRMPTWVL